MDSIKKEFPVGSEVVPSELAIREGRWLAARRWGRQVIAKVLGYDGTWGLVVRVKGRKTNSLWHHSLWERRAAS